uniref:Ephrin RBD domain-containing protein n=1 Tax=Panagrellus redivivus TaxID=6233 RepID=A0A7E4V866_PANRE
MSSLLFILLLLLVESSVVGEVRMVAGQEETFTFTGPELHIEIDNPLRTDAQIFLMCFKSYPNNVARRCPTGYASLYYWTSESVFTYKYHINRRGELLRESFTRILGKIVFNVDGSLTLLVSKLPNRGLLRLTNAEKVVPTTTTTTTEKITSTTTKVKETSYQTVFFVTGGLALLFIFRACYYLLAPMKLDMANQCINKQLMRIANQLISLSSVHDF